MVRVRIYVEGGGDSKLQHSQLRKGFHDLFMKAGFADRMPATVAGGGRERTFDFFKNAVDAGESDVYPILLVDSEDLVNAATAWDHLKSREKTWERPAGITDEQIQLMVTCMETWILADREALIRAFGPKLQISALLPENDLETRFREDVQDALARATRECGRDKVYSKGRRSFQVLAQLNPTTLKPRLKHFRRLIETLDRLLVAGTVRQ